MKLTKRYLMAAVAASALLPGLAVPAAEPSQAAQTEVTEEVVAIAMPQDGTEDQQNVAIDAQTPPSETVNTVETSEISRKMTQAEKAQNAAENDSWGGAITIIAMCIVISALIILSLLFLGFGKVSQMVLARKKREAHGIKKEDVTEDHVHVDSGDVIAAISMALAEHFDESHDLEDTILTIRRMRKAYSPWNSKIYNLRELPGLSRNPHPASAFSTRSREA